MVFLTIYMIMKINLHFIVTLFIVFVIKISNAQHLEKSFKFTSNPKLFKTSTYFDSTTKQVFLTGYGSDSYFLYSFNDYLVENESFTLPYSKVKFNGEDKKGSTIQEFLKKCQQIRCLFKNGLLIEFILDNENATIWQVNHNFKTKQIEISKKIELSKKEYLLFIQQKRNGFLYATIENDSNKWRIIELEDSSIVSNNLYTFDFNKYVGSAIADTKFDKHFSDLFPTFYELKLNFRKELKLVKPSEFNDLNVIKKRFFFLDNGDELNFYKTKISNNQNLCIKLNTKTGSSSVEPVINNTSFLEKLQKTSIEFIGKTVVELNKEIVIESVSHTANYIIFFASKRKHRLLFYVNKKTGLLDKLEHLNKGDSKWIVDEKDIYCFNDLVERPNNKTIKPSIFQNMIYKDFSESALQIIELPNHKLLQILMVRDQRINDGDFLAASLLGAITNAIINTSFSSNTFFDVPTFNFSFSSLFYNLKGKSIHMYAKTLDANSLEPLQDSLPLIKPLQEAINTDEFIQTYIGTEGVAKSSVYVNGFIYYTWYDKELKKITIKQFNRAL
jgi:hypothetical protein